MVPVVCLLAPLDRVSSGVRDGTSFVGFCVIGLKWLALLLGLIADSVACRVGLVESADVCLTQFDVLFEEKY